jgi:heme A synthase
MHAPLYSTVTLFAEIVISSIIYYTLYQGYKNNRFPAKLAGFALLYEIVFNISYMASQVPEHAKAAKVESAFVITLAIIHGILSLIMFIALLLFFLLAWRSYKKEINYFKAHKILTMLFLIFWTFSVVSGIIFYIVEYGI